MPVIGHSVVGPGGNDVYPIVLIFNPEGGKWLVLSGLVEAISYEEAEGKAWKLGRQYERRHDILELSSVGVGQSEICTDHDFEAIDEIVSKLVDRLDGEDE